MGFNPESYRVRGIVEGVFGGIEVRHGNATRCRLQGNRELDILPKALGYNRDTCEQKPMKNYSSS